MNVMWTGPPTLADGPPEVRVAHRTDRHHVAGHVPSHAPPPPQPLPTCAPDPPPPGPRVRRRNTEESDVTQLLAPASLASSRVCVRSGMMTPRSFVNRRCPNEQLSFISGRHPPPPTVCVGRKCVGFDRRRQTAEQCARSIPAMVCSRQWFVCGSGAPSRTSLAAQPARGCPSGGTRERPPPTPPPAPSPTAEVDGAENAPLLIAGPSRGPWSMDQGFSPGFCPGSQNQTTC